MAILFTIQFVLLKHKSTLITSNSPNIYNTICAIKTTPIYMNSGKLKAFTIQFVLLKPLGIAKMENANFYLQYNLCY